MYRFSSFLVTHESCYVFLWTEISPGKDLALGYGIRWNVPFFAIWIGVVALSILCLIGFPGGRGRVGSLAWIVLGGEFVLGGSLYLFLDRTVFRPANRWAGKVASGEGGDFPAGGGLLSPLHDAVCGRLAKERAALEEANFHLEAKIRELRSLCELSTAITGTLDLEELFRFLPEGVGKGLGLTDFCVFLRHPESGNLVCRASAGIPSSVPPGFTIRRGEGVSWRVFESGEAVYLPDVRSVPDFRYYGGEKPEVRSFLSIPLQSKGKILGILNVNHPEPNAFHGDSVAMIRVMAAHIAIAVENAEMFDFVKTLADKDSLTLLHNHGAFHTRLKIELERAARHARPLSVIMLDLDGFKEINDRYGHPVGDRILVMTAGVLCAQLRKSDVAARYGGDEFAVILPETDLAATSAIAGRIAAGIAQVRFDAGEGTTIHFTASIGYAACFPDSPERGAILSVADRLMYESKRRGRGGIVGEQL